MVPIVKKVYRSIPYWLMWKWIWIKSINLFCVFNIWLCGNPAFSLQHCNPLQKRISQAIPGLVVVLLSWRGLVQRYLDSLILLSCAYAYEQAILVVRYSFSLTFCLVTYFTGKQVHLRGSLAYFYEHFNKVEPTLKLNKNFLWCSLMEVYSFVTTTNYSYSNPSRPMKESLLRIRIQNWIRIRNKI